MDGDKYKTDAVLAYLTYDESFCLISGMKARKDSYFGKIIESRGMFIRKLLKLDIKDFGSIKGFTRPRGCNLQIKRPPDVFGTALSLAHK